MRSCTFPVEIMIVCKKKEKKKRVSELFGAIQSLNKFQFDSVCLYAPLAQQSGLKFQNQKSRNKLNSQKK